MASFIESVTPAAVTEQLCYIPCKFCNIVLAVSVPCSSLLDMVTVRCGHCCNLWSVNMAAAAFNSLSSASATAAWQLQQQHQQQQQQQKQQQQQQQQQQEADLLHQAPNYTMGEYRIDHNLGSSLNKYNNKKSGLFRPNSLFSPINANVVEERVVNRPPEKRQRVPSAYNQFIKEEIQRIKANNPDISHREAFSTAAKNWAHFPHIHFGLMLEASNQAKAR